MRRDLGHLLLRFKDEARKLSTPQLVAAYSLMFELSTMKRLEQNPTDLHHDAFDTYLKSTRYAELRADVPLEFAAEELALLGATLSHGYGLNNP